MLTLSRTAGFVVLTAGALAGCSRIDALLADPAPASSTSTTSPVGCRNDNDCKGARVCVSGSCVDPPPAEQPAQGTEHRHAPSAAASPRTPVPRGTPEDCVAVCISLAGMHGVTLASNEAERACANGSMPDALLRKVGAPVGGFPTIYFADINNDGTPEYVLTDRNTTGLHNDGVAAVYVPHNAAMIATPMPEVAPFTGVSFFAEPFLSVDPEGTTMNVSEGSGSTEMIARYLWKGSTVRLLDRRHANRQ